MAFGPTLIGFDSETQIVEQRRPLTRHLPVHLTPMVFEVPDTNSALARSISTLRRYIFDSIRQSLAESSRATAGFALSTLTATRDFTDRLENNVQKLQTELIIARLERAAGGLRGSTPVDGIRKVPSRLASSPRTGASRSAFMLDRTASTSEATPGKSALAVVRIANNAMARGMLQCCDTMVDLAEAGYTALATARAMAKDLSFQRPNSVVHWERLAAIRDVLKSWLTVRATAEEEKREQRVGDPRR